MRNHFQIFAILFFLCSCLSKEQPEKQPVDYINPIIGTVTDVINSEGRRQGFGKTFPGPATPFGLVQLSPDTRTGGDNGPGYCWEHTTIEGFSFTHMSGVGWFGDLGNFLVMPTTGKLFTNKGEEDNPENGYRSRFSKDDEVAKAGYYSVVLSDYNIKTELTAAPRAGMIRFTFPGHDSSRIQIDLSRRIGGTSVKQYVKVENENTISGWMLCTPEGGGWGNGAGNVHYTVYFYCQFSKPLKDYGVWSADIPEDAVRKLREVHSKPYQEIVANSAIQTQIDEFEGKHIGFFTNFNTEEGEQVLLKSGISFVSVEGAKKNLEHDIPDWDFDRVKADARTLWNDAMGIVRAEGSERDKEIFYTALYHTMIDPRAVSDIDGKYIGADNQLQQTDNFVYRTVFSGWDVFRSQNPLQTIINPQLINDQINSLIQIAELSGRKYYPRWELLNAYTGCMVGNPAVSVIVDAYGKGIRNYDIKKAFAFSKNTVDTFSNVKFGYTPNRLSETLEYAYADWCVGQFAESLGKQEIADEYYRRSRYYRNIWCPEVNWFRARDENGEWMEWEGRYVSYQGCAESNPGQQGWFVPHDYKDLMQLMGGRDSMLYHLNDFFAHTPDNFLETEYYNHPNEPVHFVPFLFNVAGEQRKTQYWTRKICEKAYGTDAYGLPGNDDVGQMSAWYILAAMGIHPICPGDNIYQLTSPVLDKVEITLDDRYYNGKKFTIIAHNNSKENIYIQTVKLNGKKLDRYWITHDEIVSGGVLEFEMGK